jgi:fucose permease
VLAILGYGVLGGAASGALAAHVELEPVIHFVAAGLLLGVTGVVMARALLGAEADAVQGGEEERGVSARGGDGGDTAAPESTRQFGGVWRNPRGALVGVIAFAAFFVEGSVDDWSGVYLHEVQGASLGFAPLAAAACGLGMATGRFRGDRLIERIGRRAALQRGALLAAVGMLGAVVAPEPVLAILGYGVLGLGVADIIPIAFTLAGNVPGVAPALSISRVTTLGYAGLFVGPPTIGFLAHITGLGWALAIAAVLLLVIATLGRSLRADD